MKNSNISHIFEQITPKVQSIYYRGHIDILHHMNIKKHPIIAIVGTRNHSNYGAQVTYDIASKLCQLGFIIVSGLANGIDSIAHQACIDHHKPTIAVLAGGLDNKTIYPRNNLSLAEKIIEQNGLLISEYSEQTPHLKHHFYLRNRIIAGMANVIIIVEAKEKSGALVTAKFALDYNKQIYGIPGDINRSQSKGVNKLLQQGAYLFTCIEDFVEELRLCGFIKHNQITNTHTSHNFDNNQKHILELLQSYSNINTLANHSSLNHTMINRVLFELESLKIIKQITPGVYKILK